MYLLIRLRKEIFVYYVWGIPLLIDSTNPPLTCNIFVGGTATTNSLWLEIRKADWFAGINSGKIKSFAVG